MKDESVGQELAPATPVKTTAYLGLGTNLGDRSANLERALRELEQAGVRVIARSRAHETEPWGITDQPKFLNMAVAVETTLTASELHWLLKEIERRMGRTPGPRYGPRMIDLDLLTYGDQRIETPELTVPHPGMARPFVAAPLAEIAPDLVLPDGRTAREARER